MNLIKWENNSIKIAPEAYGIKVFRVIWNNDRSTTKEKAVMALSLLYFMYDPRSEFQFETDENERFKNIKEEVGIPDSWKPDKHFTAAIKTYKYLTNTTSSLTLEKNRKALEKVDDYLDSVVVTDDNATKIVKIIADRSELAVSISKAEKEIYKDVEEHSAKMRGKGGSTIGDQGIENLFND